MKIRMSDIAISLVIAILIIVGLLDHFKSEVPESIPPAFVWVETEYLVKQYDGANIQSFKRAGMDQEQHVLTVVYTSDDIAEIDHIKGLLE